MLKIILILLTYTHFSLTYASECAYDNIRLQVLGSGGPELDDERNSSSYIIWYKNKAVILVDTGPGTSTTFSKTGAKFEDLKGILFTHFHVDHSADFSALIKGSYFTKRVTDLRVYGPAANTLMPSTSQFLLRAIGEHGTHAYLKPYLVKTERAKFKVIPTDVSLKKGKISKYNIDEKIEIQATAVNHGPIAAIAWRINIDGCSFAFSGDMTNQYDTLKVLARQVDILVASNAINEEASARAKSLHMPPSQIALIAKQARVRKLLLSHFMKRTLATRDQNLKIIKNIFKGEIIHAEDNMIITPTK